MEETTPLEQEETNTNRKYATSFPVVIGFILLVVLAGKFTYTHLHIFGVVSVFILTVVTTCLPVRFRSHFVVNEYFLSDFVCVIAFFLLDPFQASVASALGCMAACAILRFPIKRNFLNSYSNFSVMFVTALIARSPAVNHDKYFALWIVAALFTYYFFDTFSFYAVCRISFREFIYHLKPTIKLVSLAIGVFLGIPTCIILKYQPAYALIMFAIYIVVCLSLNKFENILSQKEQLEQLVNFMDTTSEIDKIDNHNTLLEMARNAFRHDRISISSHAPRSDKEIGKLLYADEEGEHWLIVDNAELSGKRQSHDIQMLESIAHIAGSAFEKQQLQEQLYMAARHDSLTGLANRATLEEYCGHELGLVRRKQVAFSLMFIDLDKFKPVNDQYGHRVGDNLLIEISQRLVQTVRSHDVVARIGGDEFVVLCRNLDASEAETLSRRVCDEIAKPFETEGHIVQVGASIGISSAPEDGTTFEELVRAADSRMYKAKKSMKKTRITGSADSQRKEIA